MNESANILDYINEINPEETDLNARKKAVAEIRPYLYHSTPTELFDLLKKKVKGAKKSVVNNFLAGVSRGDSYGLFGIFIEYAKSVIIKRQEDLAMTAIVMKLLCDYEDSRKKTLVLIEENKNKMSTKTYRTLTSILSTTA
jgi:hypothetical protein